MRTREGWLDSHDRPRLFLRLEEIPDQFTAIIDTGFNGYLWLPGDLVRMSRLEVAGRAKYTMLDNIERQGSYFDGHLYWFGELREVRVITGYTGDPLVGTALLRECLLEVDFPGHTVKLTR